MDSGWILISAILVFTMQAGFLCLETGKVRSKNSINVAAKNLSDLILSSIIFWMFGFAVMFGQSASGYFGTTEFFFGANNTPWQYSFFLFQMMFCGTTATLVSGAVAERMTYRGYLLITIVLCTLIYPFVGHWAWASLFNANNLGWLEKIGFIDFAGSTVVHSVGGWVSLAAILILGPRIGRFDGDASFPAGSNLPLSVLGTLLIWFGWFGFNGGSTLALTDQVPTILVNTCLAASFGGLSASLIFSCSHRYMDVSFMLNGVIAGLVAITASANVVTPASAAVIGSVAGVVMSSSEKLLIRYKIDDALGVVPTHLFAGIWGTLAVALFHPAIILLSNAFWQQLLTQSIGIIVTGVFSFTCSWLALYLINRKFPLRVSAHEEYVGMNITEHNAKTELLDLLNSMDTQEKEANFSQPVPEEPFTEVGQIARQYNRVIERVQFEMTERDAALNDFKSSEKRKSAILNSSMDSIVTINLQGKIIEFNPAAERTFGCLQAKVMDQNFIDLFVLAKDREKVSHSLKNKFVDSQGLLINRRNSIHLRRSTDDEFPAEITITGTTFGSTVSNEFTLHIRDVTRQRRLQEKLRELAYSDPLTGLYNRTYFLDALQVALRRIQSTSDTVSVFFLDLDRFKKINDTLGHQAGDQLLLEVATRLVNVTRENDIIARWGGDEFVILMVGQHDEDSIVISATKILQVMREVVNLGGRELKIPTSIGISITNDASRLPMTLIQQADIAMYQAKQAGRDNFKLFEDSMAKEASELFDFEQNLRQAIQAKKDFVMLYQPKLNAMRQVIGLEALVRLQSATDEYYSPTAFIPVAEESGQIIRLEELILNLVFKQLAIWHAQYRQVPRVSINLSGKHLLSDTFLTFLNECMGAHGIDGDWIEFEVTESVFLSDIDRCISVLRALRALSISIAIDDFGTGYSSLNYLKTLPVDVLKIDRTFVIECANQKEDAKICSTIIELASTLGLTTVAEGVETAAQFEFLQQQGCQAYQGYYFHRPLTTLQVPALFAANGSE
ncbi:ammonium transporter [Alteromonas gilva]|uniref:Ammonium transporter n=1 Tax=Alteromonas gilva TaxID=2987522 RepID=A0ABT5L1P0_9ALTE|nr:ammonium transporter [Alteromonas gilva]MDC8830958.1 ammonium transporter [Alteromonas gilva]